MPEKKVKDYWDEDWRDWKNGWPYTGDINNKKYLTLFSANIFLNIF